MYHQIVRRKIQTTFDHLNRHEYQPVVASFAPEIVHSFAGNHALGGTRHNQALARQWYERLFRLFPDLCFTVNKIVIAGLPHDTQIAVQFDVALTPPGATERSYTNQVAQFIRLRWGRITEIHLYEDTHKLVELLTTLHQRGVSEAAAPPIMG